MGCQEGNVSGSIAPISCQKLAADSQTTGRQLVSACTSVTRAFYVRIRDFEDHLRKNGESRLYAAWEAYARAERTVQPQPVAQYYSQWRKSPGGKERVEEPVLPLLSVLVYSNWFLAQIDVDLFAFLVFQIVEVEVELFVLDAAAKPG